MTNLRNLKWRKSSYSASNGSCVQLAEAGDTIGMRDSKLEDDSPVLVFTREEIRAFVAGVKAGEFDDLQ